MTKNKNEIEEIKFIYDLSNFSKGDEFEVITKLGKIESSHDYFHFNPNLN